MISLDDYLMGRARKYKSELTEQKIDAAKETILRVNIVLGNFGQDRKVASGWRPAEINGNTPNAAVYSKHVLCMACDVEDRDRALSKWCMQHLYLLEDVGLWMEHPSCTPTWVHLQTVPPRSGNRVFYPR